VTAEALAGQARAFGHRSVEYVGTMDKGIAAVIQAAREGDAIVTLGAGSVSQAGEMILEGLRTEKAKGKTQKAKIKRSSVPGSFCLLLFAFCLLPFLLRGTHG
jgi:hypothetical protein